MQVCSVAMVRMSDGERMPYLFATLPPDHSQGALPARLSVPTPLCQPTLFAVSLRNRGLAANSIAGALRAVQVLELELSMRGISLAQRLKDGRFLSVEELEGVSQAAHYHAEDLKAAIADAESRTGLSPSTKVLDLRRQRLKSKWKLVSSKTRAIRHYYIHQYLMWMRNRALFRLNTKSTEFRNFLDKSNIALQGFLARAPMKERESDSTGKGIGGEAWSQVCKTVDKKSASNPWKNEHVRERNELMILVFHALGIRRGELGGIKLHEFNLAESTIFISRHPDDIDDTRATSAETKTLGRDLPLKRELAGKIYQYINNNRARVKNVGSTPYLFVANGGKPLSLSRINQIFAEVKGALPDVLDDFYPHILRHECNTNLSKVFDDNRVDEQHEKKFRAHLMGWSETSQMPALYTKRHIKRKADQLSLAAQDRMSLPSRD